MEGRIHSVETFGTVDGPGIRYVVFMQGCQFRCKYCHNPDSWNCNAGELVEVSSLIEDIAKYKRYIQGVTVSGGEPLLQIDFVTELFKEVKKLGLDTCLDTSGDTFDKFDSEKTKEFDKLLDVCDLVMLDLKHIDEEKHKELTGKSNGFVLDFAKYLADKKQKLWLRYVLVPTINDDEESLIKWRNFALTLGNVEKVEVLPYHRLALEKYKKLGIEYRLNDVLEPTKQQIEKTKKIIDIKEGI